MKVSIDRIDKQVWITDTTIKWACWAGFYLRCNHQSLDMWSLDAYDEGDVPLSYHSNPLEHHKVVETTRLAATIAGIIENPPKPQHDCPDCKCPPKDCCR